MNSVPPPSLSVVLCTYNNADSLDKTLAQLHAQQTEKSVQVEFLIIDNNSSDHTASVIKKYSEKNPIFIYIFEARQGLSHARNTGAHTARGEYLLFTDDDAELPSNWIQNYWNIIKRHSPVCAYSKIAVIWDQPKPWWYISAFRAYFVELDYGNEILDVKDIYHEFFGKNFCVLKNEIISQGGFDPNLGRMGTKLVAGEETMIYRKIIAAQKKVIYFPDASVGHRLKAREYTLAHIHKLFLDGAYTSYNLAKMNSSKKIAGRPLGVLLQATKLVLTLPVKWLIASGEKNKPLRLLHKLNFIKSCKIIHLWIKAS